MRPCVGEDVDFPAWTGSEGRPRSPKRPPTLLEDASDGRAYAVRATAVRLSLMWLLVGSADMGAASTASALTLFALFALPSARRSGFTRWAH